MEKIMLLFIYLYSRSGPVRYDKTRQLKIAEIGSLSAAGHHKHSNNTSTTTYKKYKKKSQVYVSKRAIRM